MALIKILIKLNHELAASGKKKACAKKIWLPEISARPVYLSNHSAHSAFEEAVDAFKEQARGLIDGGCDLIVIETMMTFRKRARLYRC